MPTSNFKGVFVFRPQGNEIFSSTYFNSVDKKPFPETAIRVKPKSGGDIFEGEYQTVWLEATGRHGCILTVEKQPDGYEFIWSTSVGTKFEGHAMLEGHMLVGYYS